MVMALRGAVRNSNGKNGWSRLVIDCVPTGDGIGTSARAAIGADARVSVSTMRIRAGASRMSLTTTRARGFCTCDPIPVENAAGSRPTQAAMQVITTGRICVSHVCTIASALLKPASSKRLKNESTMMPSMAAMPNSATKPMAAETENGVPVSARANIPPINAIGITLASGCPCLPPLAMRRVV
jgi:hypothetical protein